MKVALLLGSFNPIHEGHLAILRYLLTRKAADQVRLIVSPESPFKEGQGLLDNAAQRLADARKAVQAAGLDVIVSDVEFHLPAPRYTINTLHYLQATEPGNEFVLVMGGDNIATVEHWYQGSQILREFAIWVYPRPGSEEALSICERLNASGACKGVTLFADAPQHDISSTRIRARRAAAQAAAQAAGAAESAQAGISAGAAACTSGMSADSSAAVSDIGEILQELRVFNQERDWDQFHNGKDLALALSIEAGELLECFLWKPAEAADIAKIREELADVLNYAFQMADRYGLDIKQIMLEKLRRNAEKYPVEKARGSAKKYNEL